MKTISPSTQEQEAIGFLRFSDPAQKKGGTIARQDEHIATACEENGWSLIATLVDEGKSGFYGHHRRPNAQLGQFEAEAMSGEHRGRILVTERLDRLSRETAHKTWCLIVKLNAAGVGIYTTMNKKLYPSGEELPMMDMLEILFTAFGNNEESAKKSDHIAKQWVKRRAVAKSRKLALTKLTAPWIVVHEDRTMSADACRAGMVLRWFELAAEGNGAQTIGAVLDSEGVETWEKHGRKAKIWNRTFIAATLRNREVLGEFQPKRVERDEEGKETRVADGEAWVDHLPAIVPAELFARVNREAPVRKEAARGMKSAKIVNLFSGLLDCQGCGAPLRYTRGRAAGSYVTKSGKSYSYKRDNGSLICPIGTSKSEKCSNKTYLAYLTFEDAILRSCLHLALDDNAFSNRGEVVRLSETIAQRERAHDLCATRAVNLWSAYSESPSPMAMKLAQAAEADAAELMLNIHALVKQREEARGRADGAAHLKRVADIQANLYHADLSVRVPLRKKVAQSMRALICHGNFDGEGVTLYFKGALALVRIDRKGTVDALDLTDDRDIINHADFMRRRSAAVEPNGTIFRKLSATI